MATEVLRQTPCHDTPIKTHQMEVAGCVRHPAALLPARGSKGTSCTSTEECTQMGKAYRCTPFGLTGSPQVGPHSEQSHSREVKTNEGKKQQVKLHQGIILVPTRTHLLKTSKKLVRGVPNERGTPEHLSCREVQKMTKKTIPNDQELPPLPDRAIKGLETPWFSPNGEPFHTVRLWEFENLYVLLKHDMWKRLAKHKIPHYIRTNPNQSIRVTTLKKLCTSTKLSLDEVERSVRAVRFNFCGKLEYLSFPFSMNIYAWRALCHIAGDGNVHKRKYPDLRWIQATIHQGPMRELLQRLSRPVGGKSMYVNYPKALTYAMMGTLPGLTLFDLRTPKFLQFIIDLPPSYKDWKVEFLAAFIVDDGCISKDISFYQKDETTLKYIIRLCDQLGYDHSHIYRHKRDGMHNFQLRQQGIEAFYIDIHNLASKDPILGLWQKNSKLHSVATSFSLKRGFDNRQAVEVCLTIISILGDHRQRNTDKLRQHPKLQPFLEGQPWYYLGRGLQKLSKKGSVQEVLKPDDTSHRPKIWVIPPHHDPETLSKEFLANYGNRAHKQSYKRKFITRTIVEEIIAQLKAEGIEPTPTAVARRGGFSRKVLYERDDLRRLFEDEE